MTQNESTFTTIKSKNEQYQVKVGKPVNTMVNLFFNFNVFAYMGFVEKVENLSYIIGQGIIDYENGTSGMAIELTEENSLSLFIQELPELMYLYVEMAEPTNIIRKGTKG